MSERFERQLRLFGGAGQQRIGEAKVVVVGAGGTGSHVVQQLGYLGVQHITVVEPQELDETNKNRLIGSRYTDLVPGTSKTAISKRLLGEIDPDINVDLIQQSVVSTAAFNAVKATDVLFGCVDNEATRLILTELCSAYRTNYIDIASDVVPTDPPEWGGRVCTSWNGETCLICLEEIDLHEARLQLGGAPAQQQRNEIYGVDTSELERGGPAVVSINGIIASVAVTEFMAGVTGLRDPVPLVRYRGWKPTITRRYDPLPDCYYCRQLRGSAEQADVERYIRLGLGEII